MNKAIIKSFIWSIPSPNCISNGLNPKDDFSDLIKSVGYVLKFKHFYTVFEIGEGIDHIFSSQFLVKQAYDIEAKLFSQAVLILVLRLVVF